MPQGVRFGRCELRSEQRQLLIDGVRVPLGSRAFDLLAALVANRHRVMSKSELLDRVWDGLVVEENNLSVQVSTLRKLLGPSAISTVPALGYRFVQPVDEADPAEALSRPPAPAPDADAVADTLAFARLHEQVTLCARLDGQAQPAVAARWSDQLIPLACRQVPAWAGRLLAMGQDHLVAHFASAREASACAMAFHNVFMGGAGGLRIGIHRGPAQPGRTDAEAAFALASQVPVGQTWLAAEAAAQLVRQLDGDLEAQRTDDGPTDARPPPLFRFHAVATDAPLPPPTSGPAPDLRPTLAVIPFRAYARDAGPLALGDVIADQVIAALCRNPAFKVISRLSTAAFRDVDSGAAQVGGRLAAQYVVSGRYLQADGQVQLQVELAEAAAGQVVWTHSARDHEVAALQLDSPLVQVIVQGITRALHSHELRAFRSQPLPTLASHTLLLAAINLMYRLSLRDFQLAQQALLALRERAPRHAEPLAWLARWHLFSVVQGWADAPQQAGDLALDCAHQALDIDPDSPLALTMLGSVHTNHLKDLDEADRLYDQALAINPNEPLAWLQKGNTRSFAGDGATALQHVNKAVSLSPLDPSRHHYLTILAGAALAAGELGQAIDAASESLRHNHGHLSTHRVLSIALALSGRDADARQSVQTLLRLDPQFTVAGFVARSPGARSGLAQRFGQALLAAGVPAGTAH